MNVRRFRAPTMSEVLNEVRTALGEDAVILRTRKVKQGGILSFFSKDLIEVVAATPDRGKSSDEPKGETQSRKLKRSVESVPAVEVIQDLREELKDLKGNVHELAEQMKFERMPALPKQLGMVYKRLVKAGVNEKSAKQIVQEFNVKYKGEDLERPHFVFNELRKLLQKRLKSKTIAIRSKGRPRIIVLIGSTGIGKTTTLAKLVTSYRYWGKADTALVSVDTYRVAAIEQLKTFASIAGIPMEAVYKPGGMSNALSRHRMREGIFIDTAGRSPTDTERLDELVEFLESTDPDEVLLCLSVTTRLEDQLDTIERYQKLKPTGIIFTKLDESMGLGTILNVLEKTNLPMTFLTCGQNVPDDIVTADPVRLSEMILQPDDLAELQRTHFEEWIAHENDIKRQETKVGNRSGR